MDGQEKLLDYETIKAAVAGEKWATEKVLAHYADYIDELSTVEIRQPGGKVKKVIDGDMRQHISLKLLEALPSFPLEQETIKRAAPSYAALRLSPAHPRNRYTRCASVPVSGANNDCNLRLSGLITASFKASPARLQRWANTLSYPRQYWVLNA